MNILPRLGEYNLWFTERYYNQVLHDIIEIRLNSLIVEPTPGIPSDDALSPYPDWQLYKLEDVNINSYTEDTEIKTITYLLIIQD